MGGRRSGRTLKRYEGKRDFARTPEPRGRRRRAGPMRRFCIQKHRARQLHYDLRLEHKGVLLSWAVPKGPSLNPKDKRLAMMVEDHPLDYRDFEGVIPEGYGAGTVLLWDEGTWQPTAGFEDVDEALRRGELKFTLDGVKLKGGWVLVRTQPSRARHAGPIDTLERSSWLLIKHRDFWSGPVDVLKLAPRSVKSDRDLDEIGEDQPQMNTDERG